MKLSQYFLYTQQSRIILHNTLDFRIHKILLDIAINIFHYLNHSNSCVTLHSFNLKIVMGKLY